MFERYQQILSAIALHKSGRIYSALGTLGFAGLIAGSELLTHSLPDFPDNVFVTSAVFTSASSLVLGLAQMVLSGISLKNNGVTRPILFGRYRFKR